MPASRDTDVASARRMIIFSILDAIVR